MLSEFRFVDPVLERYQILISLKCLEEPRTTHVAEERACSPIGISCHHGTTAAAVQAVAVSAQADEPVPVLKLDVMYFRVGGRCLCRSVILLQFLAPLCCQLGRPAVIGPGNE